MKLISLNLWQGRLYKNYPDFIKKHNTDVLCLQEVYDADRQVSLGDMFISLSMVKKASSLENVFFAPTLSFVIQNTKVRLGNAVLSRYPLSSQRTVFTNGEYIEMDNPEDYVSNTRNAQLANINLNGRIINLVNYHGYWEIDPEGSERSLETITKLVNEVRDFKPPLIMSGDFNLNAGSKAINYLKNELNLRDLTEEAGSPPTMSDKIVPYTASCDHIFVSRDIKVNSFTVADDLVSDHKALVLDFDI
jgi:endonuclease/exonuclease/phosphatase family metal-dependent hydrolase